MKGSPSTLNAKMFGFVAPEEGALAQSLKRAGAIILGTTNVPFMLSDYQTHGEVYPTASNPYDTTRTPGGSTGGGAAALAAGFSAGELGSDMGGSISVPAAFTRLQFARFGGACPPMWNVHQAFETPGQFLRQLCETPDGVRYLCLARDVSKPAGAFLAPVRRYAIGLGCEVQHAPQPVYSDGLDLKGRFEPIGISCRICERVNCYQPSVPPLERRLKLNPNARDVLPYEIG